MATRPRSRLPRKPDRAAKGTIQMLNDLERDRDLDDIVDDDGWALPDRYRDPIQDIIRRLDLPANE